MNNMFYEPGRSELPEVDDKTFWIPEIRFQNLDESKIRYISTHDVARIYRKKWLSEINVRYDEVDFSITPEIALSSVNRSFDIAIFGSDDTLRLATYIKQHRSLLRGKVAVCLTTKSTAQKRAKLIMSGFDDVFDTNRVHPIEGAARMSSILARYAISREQISRLNDEEVLLSGIANARYLTDKQLRVFRHLVFSPSRSASYRVLCDVAGDGPPISMVNLKVIIHNIRKLLKPGFKVKSNRQSHYTLIED